MNDLKFAFRQLLKNPGFTTVAVLTLALGIGATTVVFSLIQGVLLTPPPYPKPEQIILISPAKTDGQPYAMGCTAAQWIEWRKEARTFKTIAGYVWTFDYLILPDGSESFRGLEVTPDYFKVIGTKPLLGRTALESEASAKGDTVIVLGYDFWQRRFNGDRNVLGKTIKITRVQEPLTIVGVMPPGVRFLPAFSDADFPDYDINARVGYWIPVLPERYETPEWNVVGRLRDGMTLAQAQAELSAIAARQAKANRELEGITARTQPLTTEMNRDGRRLLLPLLGAVSILFLIACSNAAGLLLARGLQRQREYAIRCSLGAQRSRLFRQALTESVVLALFGGALGAGLAIGMVKLLKAIAAPAIPRLDAVQFGWPVFTFCFGSTVLAAALAGLLPAIRASRLDPAQALKSGSTSSAGRRERRLLGGVAIIQTSLTVALLVGAGLLIRTVDNLARVRPGYETQRILTMNVTLPNWDGKLWCDFAVRSIAQISALPGVKNAAFGWGLPLTGDKWMGTATIEGQPGTGRLAEKVRASMRSVTPEYFDALGIRIVAGRSFRSSDNWNDWKSVPEPAPGETPYVCIINQTMAQRCFPNANPIGKTLFSGPWPKRPCEIIGVVVDTRTEALTEDTEPEIYRAFLQCPVFTKHLIVRTESDAPSLIAAVQRELRAIDPTIAIEHIKTMEQIRSESVASRTFTMRLMTGFSVIGSIQAVVGIYGVLSLSVASRRREIAIRMAVGARPWSILSLVLNQGLRLVTAGLLIGVVAALMFSRILAALLFGVAPTDKATFSGVALLCVAIALLACWLPARRATRVDPMETLRYE